MKGDNLLRPLILTGQLALSFSSLVVGGCSTPPAPQTVLDAQALSDSAAASEAEKYAPQAFAQAKKLQAEAEFLQAERQTGEAAAAGEQALAAYHHAIALARAARAEERLDRAKHNRQTMQQELSRLDTLQASVAREADAFELRARVHLDQEPVADESKVSSSRALARRLAAKQLTTEARLLCVASQLLKPDSTALPPLLLQLTALEKELAVGSREHHLYPRSTELRTQCLAQLSAVRRPAVLAHPESAQSDRLLQQLSEQGTLMVYRDDRGIVVNLSSPLEANGTLSAEAAGALRVLGGTAQAHPRYPLLLVVHTARAAQQQTANELAANTKSALLEAGAPAVKVQHVGNTQPVVSPSLARAAEKNERVEVVLVTPHH